MSTRSRRVGVLAVMAAAASVVASCASGESEQSESSAPVLYHDKPAWDPTFQSLGTQADEDLGVGFESVPYTGAQQFQAFLQASLQTNQKPDLFTWHTGPVLQDLVTNNAVASSTDIWDHAIDEGWLTEDLREFYTFGDEQYCVPVNAAYYVMFYNKAAFAAAGATVPTTWTELMDAAAKLKAAGVTPFSQASGTWAFMWFQTLVAGTDPELYDQLLTGEASYTDPRVVSVMQTWQSMLGDGLMSDPTSPDTSQDLADGTVAMLPIGSWNYGTLVNSYHLDPESDFGLFVIPNVNPDLPKTSVVVETVPLCQTQDGPNSDDASEVMNWWNSPDAATIWAQERKDLPGNPAAETGDPLVDEVSAKANDGSFTLVNRYYDAIPSELLAVANDAFSDFMVHPDDPAATLQTIADAADAYWAEHPASN